MIWAIKYQAGKSPQVTQFNKSSKQVLSRELQCCSRVPVQMLPAACSGCYFIIISPHTVQTNSPGTGKFPTKSDLCETGCKQSAKRAVPGRFASLSLTKDNKAIHSQGSIFGHHEKDILRRITNYIIYIIAEHFCKPHSEKQQKNPFSQNPAFCTTTLFLGCFYRRYDLRWA